MLLGLGTFSELPFGDPNNAQIHNIEFAETGFGMTFYTTGNASTFSGTVTGTAVVSPDTNVATFSIGDETAFGEALQVLISLSSGEPNIILWSETDDSQTATWTEVSPGSTD